jgi:hypothetical protein
MLKYHTILYLQRKFGKDVAGIIYEKLVSLLKAKHDKTFKIITAYNSILPDYDFVVDECCHKGCEKMWLANQSNTYGPDELWLCNSGTCGNYSCIDHSHFYEGFKSSAICSQCSINYTKEEEDWYKKLKCSHENCNWKYSDLEKPYGSGSHYADCFICKSDVCESHRFEKKMKHYWNRYEYRKYKQNVGTINANLCEKCYLSDIDFIDHRDEKLKGFDPYQEIVVIKERNRY